MASMLKRCTGPKCPRSSSPWWLSRKRRSTCKTLQPSQQIWSGQPSLQVPGAQTPSISLILRRTFRCERSTCAHKAHKKVFWRVNNNNWVKMVHTRKNTSIEERFSQMLWCTRLLLRKRKNHSATRKSQDIFNSSAINALERWRRETRTRADTLATSPTTMTWRVTQVSQCHIREPIKQWRMTTYEGC